MGTGSSKLKGGGGNLASMDVDSMSFKQVEQAIMDANDIDTLDMIGEAAGNSEKFSNQEAWQLYSMAMAKITLWQPTAGELYNATQAQKNTMAKIVGKADESTGFKMQSDGTVTATYHSPITGNAVVAYINKKGVVKFQ